MRREGPHRIAVEPLTQPQAVKYTRGVRPHVDAATDFVELGRLLEDIDRETGTVQRQRGREAAKAATDHRNFACFASHRERVKMCGTPVSTAPDGGESTMPVPFATLTMLIGLLAFSAAHADSPPPPPTLKMVCTEQYQPVCGTKDGKRITYSNHCFADIDQATEISDGACGPGDGGPAKQQ